MAATHMVHVLWCVRKFDGHLPKRSSASVLWTLLVDSLRRKSRTTAHRFGAFAAIFVDIRCTYIVLANCVYNYRHQLRRDTTARPLVYSGRMLYNVFRAVVL